MIHSDFHAHTNRDHGGNTPEEMVRAAIADGLPALGLVGHARTEFYCDYAMTEEAEQTFVNEMAQFKQDYADRIELYCGIELDYYSPAPVHDYDYKIGSVHYVMYGDRIVSVDSDPNLLMEDVRCFYGGDFRKLYKAYFENVADIVRKTDCDIIGHFDLISKFNEDGRMFDPDHPAYRSAAMDAIDALSKTGRIFEINTGAISRGYRTEPYPAFWMLQMIRQRGGRIMLSSDAHATDTLCYRFDQSTSLARACGFTSAWVLTKDGFKEQPL